MDSADEQNIQILVEGLSGKSLEVLFKVNNLLEEEKPHVVKGGLFPPCSV